MFKFNIINNILTRNNADAFLITSDINRFWLTGFESSFGFVLALKDKIYLILDMRYYEKAKNQLNLVNVELVVFKSKKQVAELISELQIKKLIVEKEYFLFDDYLFYKYVVDEFVLFATDVMRIQKEEIEINYMQTAANIACETLEWIKKQNLIGLTEIKVANMITNHMLSLGASKNSFDPIVASGVNGAYPHHKPSDKVINNDEFVTIDIGCVYNGYCSDITRTFAIGTPDMKLVHAYNKVLEANEAGIKAIKHKINGNQVDLVCRKIIDDSEFKGYFNHGTGHGVGINVHELPNVAPGYDRPLEHNSVVTIEPGIYIPNLGGIRIEDMVLVKKDNNHVVLTKNASKQIY